MRVGYEAEVIMRRFEGYGYRDQQITKSKRRRLLTVTLERDPVFGNDYDCIEASGRSVLEALQRCVKIKKQEVNP